MFEILNVYTISGYKDIGIKKFDFVAKTQFLIYLNWK